VVDSFKKLAERVSQEGILEQLYAATSNQQPANLMGMVAPSEGAMPPPEQLWYEI
jgi:dihydroxyacid dehydratase/phosphogluconate dehydratase